MPQSLSGRFGVETNLLPHTGIRTLDCPALSLVVMPTALSGLHFTIFYLLQRPFFHFLRVIYFFGVFKYKKKFLFIECLLVTC